MKILITGANGFVGSSLTEELRSQGHIVIKSVREVRAPDELCHGELDKKTFWKDLLPGCDIVIHLAAMVHFIKDSSKNKSSEYLRINSDATVRLAKESLKFKVKKFIFISTAKVNGESGYFDSIVCPKPNNSYAYSKWHAEKKLIKVFSKSSCDLLILRPPLIYGPCVSANFLNLIRLIKLRIPLPLSNIKNNRSLLFVRNLTSFISFYICQQNKIGVNTFFISDPTPISTPDLIKLISKAMGVNLILFPMNIKILYFFASLIGRKSELNKLTSSLTVDNLRLLKKMHWSQPYTTKHGIELTIKELIKKNDS